MGKLRSTWGRIKPGFWFVPAVLALAAVLGFFLMQYLDRVVEINLAAGEDRFYVATSAGVSMMDPESREGGAIHSTTGIVASRGWRSLRNGRGGGDP